MKATQEAERGHHRFKASLHCRRRQAPTWFKTKCKKGGLVEMVSSKTHEKLDTVVCVNDISAPQGTWKAGTVEPIVEACGSANVVYTVVNNRDIWHCLLTLTCTLRYKYTHTHRGVGGVKAKRQLGYSSEGEHLPSLYKALGSVPITGRVRDSRVIMLGTNPSVDFTVVTGFILLLGLWLQSKVFLSFEDLFYF